MKSGHTRTHTGVEKHLSSHHNTVLCVCSNTMMRMPSASQVRSAVGGNDFAPASADHPAPMRFSVAAKREEAPRGMRVSRGGGKRHVQ